MLERATKRRWSLVLLDVNVDTTTAAGEFMANIMASAAQFERKLIGQRTREALAEKKAAGIVLGRPQVLALDVVARILTDRAAGLSLPKIAAALEAEGVATARGGARWYPSTIAKVLGSQAALACV